MKQRFKVPKLLHTAKQAEDFLDTLQISTQEDQELRRVRRLIRRTLVQDLELLRKTARNNPDADIDVSALHPKFKTQGSFEYGTLNNPATCPPQQIDLDDGVYFPMEFVEDKPKLAQQLLCKIVDSSLQTLVDRNKDKGWKFETKKTCARIVVSDRIHVDIPIYAIPKSKSRVLEKAEVAIGLESVAILFEDGMQRSYLRLNPNEVYLALRSKEAWVKSDPMKVLDWFNDEKEIHNGRLTRVCRYLKAWRDVTWVNGGPSSITLMAVTVDAFNEHLNTENRHFYTDCEALLAVARAMPIAFASDILNPADPDEPKLFPRNLSEDEVLEVREQVANFKSRLETALCLATTESVCVSQLISVLGNRFPNRPDDVERISVASTVRAVPAEPQAAPVVHQSFRSA